MSKVRRPRESMTLAEARRLALATQGFGRPRPGRAVGAADVLRTVRGLGLVQIDSVNVLVRSHYLPVFSRLGAYDAGLAGRRGLRWPPAPPVRVLGPRGFAAAGRAAAAAALAHAAREERRRSVEWRGALRPAAGRLLRRRAGADPPAGAARRVRTAVRRQAQRRLVGLERGQGGARVAVLVRADHHAFATALRAGVRPDRAGAAARGARHADTRGRGRAARTGADRGARHGRGDRT